MIKGFSYKLDKSRFKLSTYNDEWQFTSLNIVATAFSILALIMFIGGGYHAGFLSINEFGSSVPSPIWQKITYLGDSATALCLMLFFAYRSPASIWVMFIAAIMGLLVTHGIKHGLAMPRPPAILEPDSYNQIGQAFRKGSFPSGHSFTIFVFVTVLFYFSKQLSTRCLLILFGCVVAASRVFVGAHWPIDVLIGSALGIWVTLLSVCIAKRWHAGFTLPVHFAIVAILVTSTIVLFSHDGGYPAAGIFGKFLATVALAFFISEYLVSPYARANETKPEKAK